MAANYTPTPDGPYVCVGYKTEDPEVKSLFTLGATYEVVNNSITDNNGYTHPCSWAALFDWLASWFTFEPAGLMDFDAADFDSLLGGDAV